MYYSEYNQIKTTNKSLMLKILKKYVYSSRVVNLITINLITNIFHNFSSAYIYNVLSVKLLKYDI